MSFCWHRRLTWSQCRVIVQRPVYDVTPRRWDPVVLFLHLCDADIQLAVKLRLHITTFSVTIYK